MESSRFRDFDAFADSISGVDAVMTMRHLDRRRWNVDHVTLPDVKIQRGQLGSGNIVEGQSTRNGYMLYLPLTDACQYSANGTIMPKGSVMILEPGCEFCVSTQIEHDWCTIVVPVEKVSAYGDSEASLPGFEGATCRVSGIDHKLANHFGNLVAQTVTAATHESRFEDSPAAAAVAAELMKVAIQVIQPRFSTRHHPPGAPPVSRTRIIRACQRLIDEKQGAPVRLDELVAAAKTSERTVRRAFNEYYGVGPIGYLHARQLHRVHRTLKAADSSATTVTDVLLENGVWELGRFASHYHATFGELPSETLGKRRSK